MALAINLATFAIKQYDTVIDFGFTRPFVHTLEYAKRYRLAAAPAIGLECHDVILDLVGYRWDCNFGPHDNGAVRNTLRFLAVEVERWLELLGEPLSILRNPALNKRARESCACRLRPFHRF